ncbi:MAG: hypothetical protein QG599_921 [Pseudomonadota bacterium]|nr:hypothetical protein [Pseudomonadota bacterium]
MRDEIITAATTLAGSSIGGTLTVATIPTLVTSTVPAAGIAGWLGATTTVSTVVAAPVLVPAGAVIAVGSLLAYGAYKTWRYLKAREDSGL